MLLPWLTRILEVGVRGCGAGWAVKAIGVCGSSSSVSGALKGSGVCDLLSGLRIRLFCASTCSLAARTCSRIKSLEVLKRGEGCEGVVGVAAVECAMAGLEMELDERRERESDERRVRKAWGTGGQSEDSFQAWRGRVCMEMKLMLLFRQSNRETGVSWVCLDGATVILGWSRGE